jgi:hypothetical protein
VGKAEGRPKRRWVGNIKMDLTEEGWKNINSNDLTQDSESWLAFVKAVMIFRVP